MAESEIQFVSDETGQPVSVIVPIQLWREIESERETAYLLRNAKMKSASCGPKAARKESPSRKRLRSLEFDPDAFEDLAWWIT